VDQEIELASYTAFVGPNNSGKSTILKALDIFFKTNQKSTPIKKSDFYDLN
jgi:predicted ATP-dependent endonuclease of OLD family